MERARLAELRAPRVCEIPVASFAGGSLRFHPMGYTYCAIPDLSTKLERLFQVYWLTIWYHVQFRVKIIVSGKSIVLLPFNRGKKVRLVFRKFPCLCMVMHNGCHHRCLFSRLSFLFTVKLRKRLHPGRQGTVLKRYMEEICPSFWVIHRK